MLWGYNTNGLAHHDAIEAVELLAEIGYQSVALTIDHHCLSPKSPRLGAELEAMRQALLRLNLRSVVETGARFLLDRHVKHEPTLMSPNPAARDRRISFYRHCIDIAVELGSDCVSLWSGVLRDPIDECQAFDRLVEGLEQVLDYAASRHVVIGFEPEPGMFVDTMTRFDRLADRLPTDHFRLTLDVGHLHCQGELPISDVIDHYASRIVNVHIEDMHHGIHEHLPFGEGEIDFPPLLQAFQRSEYGGGVHVELSRHSHDGPRQAAVSLRFLQGDEP